MTRTVKTLLLRTLIGASLFLAASFAAGVTVGYMSAKGADIDTDRMLFWFALIFAIVAMVVSMATSISWMRNIDEAAREAHKSAWFWGGSGGMMVAGVGVVLASLPQSAAWTVPPLWFGRTDPMAWLAAGCFGSLLMMIVGYLVAWAWWWMARR